MVWTAISAIITTAMTIATALMAFGTFRAIKVSQESNDESRIANKISRKTFEELRRQRIIDTYHSLSEVLWDLKIAACKELTSTESQLKIFESRNIDHNGNWYFSGGLKEEIAKIEKLEHNSKNGRYSKDVAILVEDLMSYFSDNFQEKSITGNHKFKERIEKLKELKFLIEKMQERIKCEVDICAFD